MDQRIGKMEVEVGYLFSLSKSEGKIISSLLEISHNRVKMSGWISLIQSVHLGYMMGNDLCQVANQMCGTVDDGFGLLFSSYSCMMLY